MSKSSILDTNVKTYLINAIDLSGYDIDDSTTVKLEMLENIFMSEVGKWRIPQAGRQTAVMEWLQGLPSVMSLKFYNHEILEQAVQWESIPEGYTERQANKILDNYWNMLAAKLCQLFDGYRVPKEQTKISNHITGRDGADYRLRDDMSIVASTSGEKWLPIYNRYGTPVKADSEESFPLLVERHIKRNENYAKKMGM